MYASGGVLSKDGFTLIELLSVIILVIGIMLIVLPKITGSVKNKEVAINNINEEIIYRAADLYVGDNSNKYRKINEEYSCIPIKELEDKKYLRYGKKYDGSDLKYDTVQVEYKNGFRYSLTNQDSCITVKKEEKCTDKTKCNICYVSKAYNNGVYKYEGKILEGKNISLNYLNSEDFKGYTTTYGCEVLAVKEATKEFINNDRENYPADDGNTYCISLKNQLLPKGYIKDKILNDLNINIVDNYVSEVKYEDGAEIINIVESSSCKIHTWDMPNLYSGMVPLKYIKYPSNSSKYDNYTEYESNYTKMGNCSEKTSYATGYWVIADPNEEWYNYDEYWWPNAALLKSGITKKIGEKVEEKEMQAMFVWIPRFEYSIPEDRNELVSINLIKSKSAIASDGYKIHPAFVFGNNELNGFWAGKFLTSGSISTPAIVPNGEFTDSESTSFNEVYNASLNFSKINNLDDSKYDSHLMKNSEYAAILYLSDSKYGVHGNQYTSSKYPYTNCSSKSGRSNGSCTGCSLGGTISGSSKDISYKNDHRNIVTCVQSNITTAKVTSSGDWTYDSSSGEYYAKSNKDKLKYNASEDFNFEITKYGELSFKYSAKHTAGTIIGKIRLTYTIKKINGESSEVLEQKTINSTLKGGYEPLSIKLAPGTYSVNFYVEKDEYKLASTQVEAHVKDFVVNQGDWNDVVKKNYVNGTGASTTGTIYGVYDMNGISNVTSVIFDSNQYKDLYKNMGFSVYPDSKYYDLISVNASSTVINSVKCNNNICYGQAIGIEKDGNAIERPTDSMFLLVRGMIGYSNPYSSYTQKNISHPFRIILSSNK